MASTDAWTAVDTTVLAALDDTEFRTAGELRVDLPSEHVRAALKQNVRDGFVAAHRDASRTTYTITEAGRRHLADTMKVA